MLEIVGQLNLLIGVGALIMQVGALTLLLLFFFKKESPLVHLFGRYGIPLIFLVSLSALVMSLIYSEVFGFIPCGLCWFQRIFLYPQVIISGLALIKKDTRITDYLISLSVIGAVIALYQHYLQMGGTELVNCPAVSAGSDCAKRILFELGYITFPLVSFSVFALIIVLALAVKKSPHTTLLR